jgi:phenylacetate-CoA ligase
MTSPRAALYRLYWDVRSRRDGFGLTHAIRFLEESERWDRARLDALRDQKLVRLVTHAWDTSPGYRRLMEEAGVAPADVRGLADLPRLPVLTKELLRERAAELRFRDCGPVLEKVSTGGSTGAPMTVVRDLPGTIWQRAAYWRGFGWGGFHLGDPYLQLFGGGLGLASRTRTERAKAWFSGRRFLPAFELGPQTVGRYLDALARSGSKVLVGYTSAIYLLATHAERAGRPLSLAAVFPTAEPLLEGWRETMARAFGAAILPYYGCGEVQSLGYSCPEAPEPVYHSCDEHAVLEVEQGGVAALAGEGAFLVTDLDNHALPLIRYRNGDAGALAPPGCACGRTLGRILRIDGRVSDVLYTTAGAAISGAIGPHAFKLVGGDVQQFQIVQHVDRALTIRVVRGPTYDAAASEPRIDRIFKQHLGADAAIRIEYVDAIPKTPAGKSRFIINEALAAGPR